MKKLTLYQQIGLYIIMVVFDIFLIQLFRHLTPVIVWLRLGFIFLVLTASIYLFYEIVKPVKPLKTGVFYGLASFIIAITESYLIHVVIEKGSYKPLYLLPSSFALLLPVLLAVVFRMIHPFKSK